jgi:gliding motility-associated-like protein
MNENQNGMKKLFLLLFFLSWIPFAHATHLRAGEIAFTYVTGLKYEITITTYTKTSGTSQSADEPVLEDVNFGDGTTGDFPRISYQDLPNDIRHNIYKAEHIYGGSGTYDINFVDDYRNEGVVNIPNSVNTPLAVHAILNINPNFAPDNSPLLLNMPIDRGCVGVPFVHNPNAYDQDGDSLSFELVVCRGQGNLPIPNYSFPLATVSFGIDAVTGQLTWNAPPAVGSYIPPYEVNVAFEIKEWRKNIYGIYQMIGMVERDMQITISNCSNHPPVIQPMADTCVLANGSVSITTTTTDPDNNLIFLSATGGPLDQVASPQGQFTTNPSAPYTNDTVTGIFSWSPACNHVRLQPYQVLIKAKDTLADVDMVDLKSFFITVIGPAPTNLTVTPSGNSMQLHWDANACPQVTGYKIYHRAGIYPGTIECPCQTGVPSYTGYTLIGTNSGLNNTNFTDNNNGQGLAIGALHCYLVVAVFPDGSESCASNQACERLKKDLPVITNVSVDTTDASIGAMYVAWSKPNELDTIQFPPPYLYKIYHDSHFTVQSPVLVGTFPSLDDTIFYDESLNTIANPYSYYVELYYNNGGVPALKGKSSSASSIFLKPTSTDNKITLSWEEHVPWGNYRYVIYRLNTVTSLFDSIAEIHSGGNILTHTYTDTGLVNGTQYCYKIKSVGTYSTSGILDTLINFSQEICATPIDNVPPCAPQLTVSSFCEDEANRLSWTNPAAACADHDLAMFNIYYSPDSSTYELIATIPGGSLSFIHSHLSVLAGCYKITAQDSMGNESTASSFCVDTCRQYVLPSVFTPDGDGNNDFFHPCDSTTSELLQKKNCPPYKNVKDIEIKIYDRWGLLVFETTNKDINWDGTNQKSKGNCPDGVYYYTCRVNFLRLHGTEMKKLNGYIHLIRGK